MALEHPPDVMEDAHLRLGRFNLLLSSSMKENFARKEGLATPQQKREHQRQSGTLRVGWEKAQADDSGDKVSDGISLLHGTKTTSLNREVFGGGGGGRS